MQHGRRAKIKGKLISLPKRSNSMQNKSFFLFYYRTHQPSMERKQIRNGGDKINLKRGVGSYFSWSFVFLNNTIFLGDKEPVGPQGPCIA